MKIWDQVLVGSGPASQFAIGNFVRIDPRTAVPGSLLQKWQTTQERLQIIAKGPFSGTWEVEDMVCTRAIVGENSLVAIPGPGFGQSPSQNQAFQPGDLVYFDAIPSPRPSYWAAFQDTYIGQQLEVEKYDAADNSYKCIPAASQGYSGWYPASCLKPYPALVAAPQPSFLDDAACDTPETPQERIIRLRNEFRKQFGGTR